MSREEKIALIVLLTGWSEQVFKSMNDDEVEKIYKERVVDRDS